MSKHLGVEYKVRMPQELKDKIADSAKELNRSINQDIVARLEKSFAPIDLDEIEKQLNDYYYSNDLIPATPIRLPRINNCLLYT
ncbi:Arc family DNA-binding protein, partial [Acinetobacter baumannii]|uniref:Arc family DNA-binding protein n=1 Tax=Acinetobacter baumannii TaxID=470 RepID=UPI0020188DED